MKVNFYYHPGDIAFEKHGPEFVANISLAQSIMLACHLMLPAT
jgi:hypothetical protein